VEPARSWRVHVPPTKQYLLHRPPLAFTDRLETCTPTLCAPHSEIDAVKRALEDSCQRERLLRRDLKASLEREYAHKQQSAAAELALQIQLRALEKSLHGAEVELDRARARVEERRLEFEVCEVKWREKEQEWRTREHMLVENEHECRERAEKLKSECDLARASQEAMRCELVQSRTKAQQAALEARAACWQAALAERQGLEREAEAARRREAAAQDFAVLAFELELTNALHAERERELKKELSRYFFCIRNRKA
jgi:hypothetical protein